MTDTAEAQAASPPSVSESGHAHPTPKDYWIIFAILAVITAIEIAIVYVDVPKGLIAFILITASIFKFILVVAWYMHLRFERPLFRRFFLIGVFGALILYSVVLATFGAVETFGN